MSAFTTRKQVISTGRRNGWSDSYSGERYQPVTEDEMYVQPISGYIE